MTTDVVCCAKLADQAGAGGFQSGGMWRGEDVSAYNSFGLFSSLVIAVSDTIADL